MSRTSNQPLFAIHKGGTTIRLENKTASQEFVMRVALGSDALWNLAVFYVTLNADELQALAQGAMNARAILLADQELRAALAAPQENYGGSA